MEEIKIEILNNDVYLTKECWNCTNKLQQHTEPCNICDGDGYIPTVIGKTILEFVKRYEKN